MFIYMGGGGSKSRQNWAKGTCAYYVTSYRGEGGGCPQLVHLSYVTFFSRVLRNQRQKLFSNLAGTHSVIGSTVSVGYYVLNILYLR